jgi:hypothetical protein
MRLRWSESDWTEFTIDWPAPPRSVDWSCTAAHMTSFSPPDEWVGTSMVETGRGAPVQVS